MVEPMDEMTLGIVEKMVLEWPAPLDDRGTRDMILRLIAEVRELREWQRATLAEFARKACSPKE